MVNCAVMKSDQSFRQVGALSHFTGVYCAWHGKGVFSATSVSGMSCALDGREERPCFGPCPLLLGP